MTAFLAIPAGTLTVGALGSALGIQTAITIAEITLAATATLSPPTIRRLPGRPQPTATTKSPS